MVTKFQYQLREGVSREHGVYLSLTPPGKAKAIRSYRLDAGYMPVDIAAKIEGRYIVPDRMSDIDIMPDANEMADMGIIPETNEMADRNDKREKKWMLAVDKMPNKDADFYKNKTLNVSCRNKKQDWMMSRNYTFIPYQNLSDYQKALVRKTLDAKRMYRRTGTSLQLHEQSVRAIKGMMREMRDVGIYRKISGRQSQSIYRQQQEQKKVHSETQKWRQK